MEDVGIFYVCFVYLTAIPMVLFVVIWCILLSSGIFFRWGISYQEKSGNPDTYTEKGCRKV
jgi:hypothetical protein